MLNFFSILNFQWTNKIFIFACPNVLVYFELFYIVINQKIFISVCCQKTFPLKKYKEKKIQYPPKIFLEKSVLLSLNLH